MTDDLLSNFTDRRPPRPTWLREYFEGRTVVEMSIWFWIAAVSSLIAGTMIVAAILNWIDDPNKPDGDLKRDIIVGGLVLWAGFLVWLWISFVRIARGWGPERMGTPIFRYLQMGLAVAIAVVVLPVTRGPIREFLGLLLAFDFAIMGMVGVFLALAWCARCKVPWQTYFEIFTMIALFITQIVLVIPRKS